MQKHTLKEKAQQLMSEFGELALKVVSCFLLVIVYLVFGSLLAVPYTFLAGGDVGNFIRAMPLAPLAIFALMLGWIMRPIGRERDRRLGVGDYIFWGFVVYLSLPILLNGASLLLGQLGYERIAHAVFVIRYAILFPLPVALFALLIVVGGVMITWEKIRGLRDTAPPSPPSDPPQLQQSDSRSFPESDNPTDWGGQSKMVPTM